MISCDSDLHQCELNIQLSVPQGEAGSTRHWSHQRSAEDYCSILGGRIGSTHWCTEKIISYAYPDIYSQQTHFDGLVQETRNSSALAMELRLSCTNPSIYGFRLIFTLGSHRYIWVSSSFHKSVRIKKSPFLVFLMMSVHPEWCYHSNPFRILNGSLIFADYRPNICWGDAEYHEADDHDLGNFYVLCCRQAEAVAVLWTSCVTLSLLMQKKISLSFVNFCFKSQWMLTLVIVLNILRLRRNRCHYADDICKCIFLNENMWISIKISLTFVPKGPINNIPALHQIMAWRWPGNKPLSEPMMVRLLTHMCVTRP